MHLVICSPARRGPATVAAGKTDALIQIVAATRVGLEFGRGAGIFGARARQAERSVRMPAKLTWNDSEEIGFLLHEKFPELDPLALRFTDLYRRVCELEGFDDDPQASNEKRLEAIQMAWYEARQDAD
jgi:FeS assembly protein IscX